MDPSDDDLRRLLRETRTIAVLGAHPDPSRPAHYVPDYLHRKGYRILPVNPAHAGRELWGEPVRSSLAEIGEPVDVVDVFRRPEHLPAHVADLLAVVPRPRLVWFQSGIVNAEVALELEASGVPVVQDRCLMAEHRRLG